MESKDDNIDKPKSDGNGGFLNSLLFLNNLRKNSQKEKKKVITKNFELIELASYGFPGIANCYSYCPIQKLLAIGTSTGRVVILGNSGIALRLNITLKHGITEILFLSNLPLVICITQLNEVILLDIINITINKIYHCNQNITCIETYPDSKWLLIGTDKGEIQLLDLVYGVLSEHKLHCLESSIRFLKIHPVSYTSLLAASETGEICLINLKTGKLILNFLLNEIYSIEQSIILTSICWNPKGDYFVTGYDNGWLIFWDPMNNKETICTRTIESETIDIALELALPEERESIISLQWCQFNNTDESFLYIIGGNDIGQENNLTILKFILNDIKSSINKESISITQESLKKCTMMPLSSPWNGGLLNPKAIICLSKKGNLYSYNLIGESIQLHLLLQWLSFDIQHSKLISQCSPIIYNAIIAHETSFNPQLINNNNNINTNNNLNLNFELEGGILLPKQVDHFFYDFLLTSHQDGAVRLWDSSTNVLEPISHLTIWPNKLKGHENSQLTGLNLDANTGHLIATLNHNSILVYQFCHRSKCHIHTPESSQSSSPNYKDFNESNESNEEQKDTEEKVIEGEGMEVSNDIVYNPRTQDREDIYIYNIKQIQQIDKNIYPSFELLGHRGNIAYSVLKNGFLIVSDTYGGFSITEIQLKKLIYFEREIQPIVVTKFSTMLPNSNQQKDPCNSIEFISQMDIKTNLNELKILGITNNYNIYMVTLDLKDNNRKISKGKIFTYNEIDQTPTYISFYSKQVESILPTSIDMKSPEQQEPKEILEEKEKEENKDSLSKKPTWKGLKDINNAANRLTKKFTITGNGKKKSKDSMLAKIVSRKSSVQSIKEDKKKENELIEEKEQVGDLEKKIENENENENQTLMNGSLISEKDGSSPPSPTLSLDTKSKQNSKEISSVPSSPVDNRTKQMSKDKNNKEILTSPSSPAENKIKTLSKDGLDPNDYSIICFETKIIVHKHKDKKVLNKVTVEEDRGRILTAKYVRNHENDILVCLTSRGFVDVYDLPELNFIHKTEIPLSETYNLNQCTITPDGRIFVNINPFELKQYCLYEDHDALSSPLCSKIQLYDPTKFCPELPIEEIPWYSLAFNRVTKDTIIKVFERHRSIDAKPVDRTKSNRYVRIRKYSDAAHNCPLICGVHSIGASQPNIHSSKTSMKSQLSENNNDIINSSSNSKSVIDPNSPIDKEKPKSGLAAMLSQTTDKLKEREDKLSNIEEAMKDTSEASRDFLNQIKAYNQRQANKKWYQL